jgi:hypothetical protein
MDHTMEEYDLADLVDEKTLRQLLEDDEIQKLIDLKGDASGAETSQRNSPAHMGSAPAPDALDRNSVAPLPASPTTPSNGFATPFKTHPSPSFAFGTYLDMQDDQELLQSWFQPNQLAPAAAPDTSGDVSRFNTPFAVTTNERAPLLIQYQSQSNSPALAQSQQAQVAPIAPMLTAVARACEFLADKRLEVTLTDHPEAGAREPDDPLIVLKGTRSISARACSAPTTHS